MKCYEITSKFLKDNKYKAKELMYVVDGVRSTFEADGEDYTMILTPRKDVSAGVVHIAGTTHLEEPEEKYVLMFELRSTASHLVNEIGTKATIGLLEDIKQSLNQSLEGK